MNTLNKIKKINKSLYKEYTSNTLNGDIKNTIEYSYIYKILLNEVHSTYEGSDMENMIWHTIQYNKTYRLAMIGLVLISEIESNSKKLSKTKKQFLLKITNKINNENEHFYNNTLKKML